MQTSTNWVWGILIVLVLVIVVGIARQPQKGSDRIRIGVITAMTGPYAGVFGEPLSKGVNMALREIDPDLKKYDIVYEDYQLDTKLALPAYTKLKSEGIKLFVLEGSAAISVLAPEIRKEGLLSMNSSSFVPSYKDGLKNTCRTAITADNYAPAYTNLLINKLNAKKVAIFLPNIEAGVALAKLFRTQFESKGGTIVTEELYPSNETDFRTQILKLRATKGVDAIVAVNYTKSVTEMFKQMKELGLKTQIVTDDWTIDNQALTDKSLVEGANYVGYSFSATNPKNDSQRKFLDDFKKEYSMEPTVMTVMGYDLMKILDTAIVDSKSIEPMTVAGYLSTKIQNYEGVGGNISLNSDCEATRDIAYRKIVGGKETEIK